LFKFDFIDSFINQITYRVKREERHNKLCGTKRKLQKLK
jgi:hypothetical protein